MLKHVVVAGGPSLRHFQFSRLRGDHVHVVAVNDSALHVPQVDTAFTIDTVWLRERRDVLHTLPVVAAVPPTPYLTSGTRLNRVNTVGVSSTRNTVHTGGNSGFAAVSWLISKNVDAIGILGLDLTTDGHWFPEYGWSVRFGVRDYAQWARNFDTLVRPAADLGIDVVNFNSDSAVTAFPRRPREEIFDWLVT